MTFLVAKKVGEDLFFARKISNTLPWSWAGDARLARWFKDEADAAESLQEIGLPEAFVLEGDELIAQAERRQLAPEPVQAGPAGRPLLGRLKGLFGS